MRTESLVFEKIRKLLQWWFTITSMIFNIYHICKKKKKALRRGGGSISH